MQSLHATKDRHAAGRLLDGTRLCLHGVVDNFSRRLLAWRLAEKLDPWTTCQVLRWAIAPKGRPGCGTKKLPQLPKQGSIDADGCVARYLPRSPACGIMLVGRWCYAPGRGPALGLTH
jgi:hypothetical protein